MKIRRTIGYEFFHGKEFPMGTIVLTGDSGAQIFCSDFRMRKGKISVLIYIPGKEKFLKTEMRNEYTKAMYDYAQQFKDDSKRLNYKQMMSHDRKRKCGSGGVRLGKFCGQITDYECTKNPMHDFRRVYC